MSPDSPLGLLAQRVSKLEQRVEDTLERMAERFAEIAENFRVFGPVVQDHSKIRSDVEHLSEDFRDLKAVVTDAIHEFRTGMDQLEEREEQREQRRLRDSREDRRDTWTRRLGMAAVVVAILSSTASIVVTVLS